MTNLAGVRSFARKTVAGAERAGEPQWRQAVARSVQDHVDVSDFDKPQIGRDAFPPYNHRGTVVVASALARILHHRRCHSFRQLKCNADHMRLQHVGSSCATYCHCGVSTMRQAPFIATELPSRQSVLHRQKTEKSIFAVIFEALHHSRHLQAERTLRQYRHLIDKAERDILREPNKRSGASEHVSE